MPEPAKRNPIAPRFLQITVKDSEGKEWVTLVEIAGRYRTGGVGVFSGGTLIHISPPHHRVSLLMEQLLQWVKNAPLPKVLKNCIFHYEFEFIHPFADGNRRMGRMWQTLLLFQEHQIFAWLPVETITLRKN